MGLSPTRLRAEGSIGLGGGVNVRSDKTTYDIT